MWFSRIRKLVLGIGMLGILFALLGSFAPYTYATKATEATVVSPTDPHIQYFGRWEKTKPVFNSYWPGAYFKVGFTGTTAQLQLAAPVNIYVKIDNGSYNLYPKASGVVNLTPLPLTSGSHTLTVASRDIGDVIPLKGLILDSGAATQAPTIHDPLIEFIGDSITVGYETTDVALSSYAWLTAEQLNAEHTQIAYTGICLVDQIACYSTNLIGMSKQFFKLKTVAYSDSPEWNFNKLEKRQPSAVVINLGTNDSTFHVSNADFQSTYTDFLAEIREKYPLASIFVLRTFGGYQAEPTLAAVNSRIVAGDAKLHYIDTTGWLRAFPSPDYLDGVHPSDRGHLNVANRLAPILQPYLQGQNRNSALSEPEMKKENKLSDICQLLGKWFKAIVP
ncbi:SGNH/GDSL hydrolase family protein [Paenibacillus agricola]|uniref:SGNH/GDSL hydrolase family protein n=1 Tax=Paenibacillus agricola TaxID=2716264 RepID=A0ABX0J4M0_9BACL|nr:SGNH/GDSL hydrolase family protein [Paenibacillus agricola]NHN31327.1 SGNH/GDSL hydrolase family protein [Paenibacillus agricola]